MSESQARSVKAVPAQVEPVKDNRAEVQSVVLPGQTPAGEYILSVLVKRSYQWSPNGGCERASEDQPLVTGDEHWGDPMNSSVQQESDFVPFKNATDVALNGTAYAPDGRETETFIASVSIGETIKSVQVIGPRFAEYVNGGQPIFSSPEPLAQLDLRYENAYGGIDVFSNEKTHYPYPNNLLGKGFIVENNPAAIKRLPLPMQEDPNDLITAERLCVEEYENWENQPFPCSLGWYQRNWWGRGRHAGVMPADRVFEQELRTEFSKLLSGDEKKAYEENQFPDMDFRYFSAASPGLVFPYMQGGETVITQNLTRDGETKFHLPTDVPRVGLDIGQGIIENDTVRHTVQINMNDRTVDIVWRMAVLYEGPDWLPGMEKLQVHVQ